MKGALYDGTVTHQRLRPRRHRLRYRLFQLLLDLDELPQMERRLRLFGYNRPAIFSLHDRDHLAGEARPLRPQVESILRAAGMDICGGPIRLLCMPRVLGYVFNRLSIFYCHQPSGELAAVVLEVNNTFDERHCYVLEAAANAGEVVRRDGGKTFFVSPFLGLDMTYDFRISAPAERVATAIVGRDPAGAPLIVATFLGRRRPLRDREFAAAFIRHPLLTLKVVAAIHWEAARLAAKGFGLRRKPAPPPQPVTILRAEPRPASEPTAAGPPATDPRIGGLRGTAGR